MSRALQRVLAERDADSGQVTVQQTPSPPTGRQTLGLRTDVELRGWGAWEGDQKTATHSIGAAGGGGSQCQSHTHAQLTTIARIHSKCQEANISSRIRLLSQLSSQGSALGSLWINYSETISLQTRQIKVQRLQ